MKDFLHIMVIAAVLAAGVVVEPAYAESEEFRVYVVYQSDSKELSKAVITKIPTFVKIRKYNTDLLLLANYTAKQKVVSKFLQSDLIILVGSETRSIFGEILDNATTIDIRDHSELETFEFMPMHLNENRQRKID